ncbi:MAG: hypothetical protein K0Q87_4145 [Neobacillus sp.]|jgi:hypothetical protein|nr:hypothetical protein [Neobacillus sp.]MDF2858294.1 hypothetical protein [Neobacillus sp.]
MLSNNGAPRVILFLFLTFWQSLKEYKKSIMGLIDEKKKMLWKLKNPFLIKITRIF